MKNETNRWVALFAMSLGVFMGLLDVTVVNVALPSMAIDFKTTFSNLQWILNAYTLMFAVSLLIVSKLGDMFGRKKIFILSMILFTIASVVNGLAPNLLVLDIGRAVQAIGGSGMMSLSMALVASNFSGRERGTALGILGSVIGFSTAIGPLVGGLLVENFGWPSIFFVNLPVGIIAVYLVFRNVKETPAYGAEESIDFMGMILSAIGLFAGIYGLIQKEQHMHWAWTDMRIMGWLVASIVILAIFVFVELKVKSPMMNLKLLTNRHFVGVVILAFALGAGIFALAAYQTSLMQNYMGYSAFTTGLRQLPMSLWSLVLGPFTGVLGYKFGKKWMIAFGFIIAGVGLFTFSRVSTTDFTYLQLLPLLVLTGLGNAIINPMINTAAMDNINPKEIGMASGLLNVFRQIGITVGVVVLGLAQTKAYEASLNTGFSDSHMPNAAATGIHQALVNAGAFSGHMVAWSQKMTSTPYADKVQNIVLTAFNKGMIQVVLTSLIMMIIGVLGAIFLLRETKSVDQKLDK
ncbi:MFS transporter [Dellaglioa carnosa]|uniref:MFS transporter n=1 Tax=Dellaglioa carnosa TaxID=2995136 RepID=UPI0022A87C2F|nr:MFS transporter [Dellaglioa carnosa]MCZ2492820.1 MFS transporter [Dellaglioa carnosa]